MTELLYMQDFDVQSCESTVSAINANEAGKTDIILDKTCFYPRGGGQDWDMGTITNSGGSFAVEEVRLDENGDVRHIGSFTEGRFGAGDNVLCAVDGGRRFINTRLHSAGHVIDMAVDSLGLDWVATKGQHYPH
ncbi:MAG: alanine--tRNA ligase-related protein, partial [Candidatus Saccharimonadales bacterium]